MMKTNRLFFYTTLALAVIACRKGPDDSGEGSYLREFVAPISGTVVKAALNVDTGESRWNYSDEIYVDNMSSSAKFKYNVSRDCFVCGVTDFPKSSSYVLFYPASFVESSQSGLVRVTIPAVQKYNGLRVSGHLLGAKVTGDDFTVHNLCSVVRIEFPVNSLAYGNEGNIKKIEVTTPSAPLAGEAVFDGVSITFESSTSTSLTVDCGENDVNAYGTIAVALPAQTYPGGLNFKFTFKDNSEYVLKTDGDVTLGTNEVSLVKVLKPWTLFQGGSGTVQDPYVLGCQDDFVQLQKLSCDASEAEKYCGACYRLSNDVDLNGLSEPLFSEEFPFKGVFDGNGKAVYHFNYSNTGNPATGLFRYTDGATISNLKIADSEIHSTKLMLGAFSGRAVNTLFRSCSFDGRLVSDARKTTDICPGITGDKDNFSIVGGIVGFANGCTFEDCLFDGKVSALGKCVGGIAGYVENNTIMKGCSAAKDSEAYSSYHCIGGLAGALASGSKVQNCVSAAFVGGLGYWAGGIVGYLKDGMIENCVVSSAGHVSLTQYTVGGVCGAAQPASGEEAVINSCTVYADVQGQYNVGGIVGAIENAGSVTISDCAYLKGEIYSTGTNGGSNYYNLAGGIAGWIKNTAGNVLIENCCALPTAVKGTIDNSSLKSKGSLGGLVAFNQTSHLTIGNCYSSLSTPRILISHKPVTLYPDALYGLFGRFAAAPSFKSDCYKDTDLPSGDSDAYDGNIRGMSVQEMTNGTLLGKLNAAGQWKAGENSYPVPQDVIADPYPGKEAQKRVSVIGDSISSFAGYIPAGYNYHYPCRSTGHHDYDSDCVTQVNQTYWHQVIYDYMSNARLDLNMSYSGSAVTHSTNTAKSSEHWYRNSYVDRYIRLGGVGDPDVVLLHGGTNDWAHNDCPLYPGSKTCKDETNVPTAAVLGAIFRAADAADTREKMEALPDTDFCSAYVKLMCLLQQQYPGVKIVCIIGDYLSVPIERAILSIAAHYGQKTVDLYAVNGFNDLGFNGDEYIQRHMPKHDFTGSSGCHPNAKAMAFISEKIYSELGPWLEE